jgi:hypothetical protein
MGKKKGAPRGPFFDRKSCYCKSCCRNNDVTATLLLHTQPALAGQLLRLTLDFGAEQRRLCGHCGSSGIHKHGGQADVGGVGRLAVLHHAQ